MPEKNLNILFALGLRSDQMIDYFESKGYEFSWNWREVFEGQHSHAFTVAKVMKLDILMDIQAFVNQHLMGDITDRNFYINLEQVLRSKGWWGKLKAKDVPGYDPQSGVDPETEVQLGSPYRLKKILETNINVSVSAGRYRTQEDAASFAPYWQYVDQDDHRVRPLHNKIGILFKKAVLIYSHPFWDTWYPPNDWGCRCFIRNYTLEQIQEKKLIILEDIPDWLKSATPGEGWAYNPGKEKWNPDLTKYPDEFIEKFGLK